MTPHLEFLGENREEIQNMRAMGVSCFSPRSGRRYRGGTRTGTSPEICHGVVVGDVLVDDSFPVYDIRDCRTPFPYFAFIASSSLFAFTNVKFVNLTQC